MKNMKETASGLRTNQIDPNTHFYHCWRQAVSFSSEYSRVRSPLKRLYVPSCPRNFQWMECFQDRVSKQIQLEADLFEILCNK